MQSSLESSEDSRSIERHEVKITSSIDRILYSESGKVRKLPNKVIEMICCRILDRQIPKEFADMKMVIPPILICRPDRRVAPLIFEVDERRTAREISKEILIGYLWAYLAQINAGDYFQFMLTSNMCKNVVTAWLAHQTHIYKLPKVVGFKSDKDIVMSRLTFTPDRSIKERSELRLKAPFFYQILERMANAEAFCARVGSIYDLKSDRKQIVWMYGPTDGGKSLIDWMVRELSGMSATKLTNDELKGKFWRSKLLNKRVCLVGEATAKFIRSSSFKDVTGDSQQSIERKGVDSFDADINTLFFCSSNEPPRIPNDTSLSERIIPVYLESIDPQRRLPEHEARACIVRELPAIAGYCMAAWSKIEGRIDCDQTALVDLMHDWDDNIHDWISAYVIEDPKAMITNERMKHLMQEGQFFGQAEQRRVIDVLLKEFPDVKCTRRELKTEVKGVTRKMKVFVGLRQRKAEERRYHL